MSFQSKIRSHNHKVIKIALQTADSTTVWPGNCAVFAVSKNQLQLQLQRPFPLLHEFSQKPLSHWRLQATAYIYNHNSTHNNNNNKNKSSYHDQKNQVISTQQWGSERVGLSRAEHVLSQSAVHNLNKKNYQWSSLQRSYNTFSWNWLWNLKFKRHKGRGQSIHVHAHAPLSSREHSKTAHRLPTTEACIAWRNALKKENWHGRWHGHLTCVYFNVIRQPRLHCTAHCNSTLDSIIVAKRRFQPGFFRCGRQVAIYVRVLLASSKLWIHCDPHGHQMLIWQHPTLCQGCCCLSLTVRLWEQQIHLASPQKGWQPCANQWEGGWVL